MSEGLSMGVDDNIYPMDEGARKDPWPVIKAWREEGLGLIWTNGCFDLFHAGHAKSLRDAKTLVFEHTEGQVSTPRMRLIVGVNDDVGVRILKGYGRPIIPLEQRMQVVAAHRSVDMVLALKGVCPADLISLVKPKWIIKGEDWRGKCIIGSEVAEAQGGTVLYVGTIPRVSTTDIIYKIANMGEHSIPMEEDFMTMEETIAYLRLPRPALKSLVRRRDIPHAKLLDKVVFSRRSLTKWMRMKEKDSGSSPPTVE